MPGVTVVNTTRCAVDWVKDVYAKGGRNFIFQNVCHSFLCTLYLVAENRIMIDDSASGCYSLLQHYLPQQVLDRRA